MRFGARCYAGAALAGPGGLWPPVRAYPTLLDKQVPAGNPAPRALAFVHERRLDPAAIWWAIPPKPPCWWRPSCAGIDRDKLGHTPARTRFRSPPEHRVTWHLARQPRSCQRSLEAVLATLCGARLESLRLAIPTQMELPRCRHRHGGRSTEGLASPGHATADEDAGIIHPLSPEVHFFGLAGHGSIRPVLERSGAVEAVIRRVTVKMIPAPWTGPGRRADRLFRPGLMRLWG